MKITCYFNVHDYMPDIINPTAWPSFVIFYTLHLCSSSYGKGYKRNYIISNLSPSITVDCSHILRGGGGREVRKGGRKGGKKQLKKIYSYKLSCSRTKTKFRHRWHDFSIGRKKSFFSSNNSFSKSRLLELCFIVSDLLSYL